MYIFSRLAVLSLSFFLLAGCETTGGSAATYSIGSWQGWTSVLQILEKAMVSEDGRQLATMQDFQTRLITAESTASDSALPAEVLDQLSDEDLAAMRADDDAVSATATVTPTAAGNPSSGTIEVTLFARGQLHRIKIRDVPLNGRGEPTAASSAKIKRAALAFKNQVFGTNAQPAAPVLTEEQIIDQLLAE